MPGEARGCGGGGGNRGDPGNSGLALSGTLSLAILDPSSSDAEPSVGDCSCVGGRGGGARAAGSY